jgi:hypothetical protein
MEIARFLIDRASEQTAGRARALARIVALHTADASHECPGATGGPCPTLRLLAAAYSWHPDYNPLWSAVFA